MAILPSWRGTLRGCVPRNVAHRSWEVLRVNWHLGFTAFGGPPAHFKILNDKFVNKVKWIDESMYLELFSICQALSGPASTKLLYCINLIHGGTLAAILSFMIWSLPGALGMYGLSIGVAHIGDSLPRPAYALLSGLNAATVGIIALSSVELSQRVITDKMTRILVFLTATAGLMYKALWYFPVLVAAAGCATVVHDYRWLHRPAAVLRRLLDGPGRLRRRRTRAVDTGDGGVTEEELAAYPRPQDSGSGSGGDAASRRAASPPAAPLPTTAAAAAAAAAHDDASPEPRVVPANHRLATSSWRAGATVIAAFLLVFVVVLALRGALPHPPLPYSLFANMVLAGTIIFGGGPVVVPLLREYVVAQGWVAPRDFLIGLAVVQAFPGPNFNFAVFLGSLAVRGTGGGSSSSSPASLLAGGAVLAWLGIFAPGMVLVHGTMGIWSALRGRRWLVSALRGVNAGAVGLIYTAVYRIWQVGYLDEGFELGRSLGDDPWWLVVAATSYVGGRWFGVPAPAGILLGGAMGLIRYGVVSG